MGGVLSSSSHEEHRQVVRVLRVGDSVNIAIPTEFLKLLLRFPILVETFVFKVSLSNPSCLCFIAIFFLFLPTAGSPHYCRGAERGAEHFCPEGLGVLDSGGVVWQAQARALVFQTLRWLFRRLKGLGI